MTNQSVQTVTKHSVEEWVEIINADWRKNIDDIFATANDLIEAHDDLGENKFYAMLNGNKLLIPPGVAANMMRIGHDSRIKAVSRQSLPASWRILSALTHLDDEDFRWARKHKLISNKTSLRVATSIKQIRKTPKGDVWGKDKSVSQLPNPKEARQIARTTGRFVAASDKRIYSGATEEEGAEADRCITQTYKIIDAIQAIADVGINTDQWLKEAQDFQLHKFRIASLDAAIEWLTHLRPVVKRRQGIIDNGE